MKRKYYRVYLNGIKMRGYIYEFDALVAAARLRADYPEDEVKVVYE